MQLPLLEMNFPQNGGKYKLTLPVKRIDIVKSLYINQLLWIMIGVFFVGIIIALSYLLHGITFEQFEGISGVLVVGISISLSMGAIFIPMVYLAGEDKTIVFLIISLICALGIVTMLFNIPLFGTIYFNWLFYIVIYRVLSFDCRYFQGKGILGDKATINTVTTLYGGKITICGDTVVLYDELLAAAFSHLPVLEREMVYL